MESKNMYLELREGIDAVVRTLRQAMDQAIEAASFLKDLAGYGVNTGFVIGSGTSFHASLFLQNLMNKYTDFSIVAVPASEFAECQPVNSKKYFIIGFSQSGESSDIVVAFNLARSYNMKTLTITNTPGSTLTRIADACIITKAGEEKAVTATKTFDVQLAASLMLTYALSDKPPADIEKGAQAAAAVLNAELKAKELAAKLAVADHVFCLGKGSGHPIALEAALKLKEAAMIHAEGFASREFLHGPIQLADEKTPVLLFMPSSEAVWGSQKVLEKLAQYGAPVYIIGPRSVNFVNRVSDWLETPDVGSDIVTLPLAKAAQLLAYYASIAKGLNPDKPSKLSKVVKY
ncbi:MAG: SIS domain-containing protein [Thermofilaceae archaeon]